MSDKAITQESGILLPGDVVLADRGFTNFDLVKQYQAMLNYQPSLNERINSKLKMSLIRENLLE